MPTLAARLLASSRGGGGITLPPFPTDWNLVRYVGNPVIDVTNNPSETTEQYTPAPIRLPNGDVWVYVKGLDRIYAWKSTDGGETFALQNSNTAVIAPGAGGTWDEDFVVDPAATYDPATDTIHLYYKGTNVAAGTSGWGWGHATSPGSDPTDVTKDAANPILSQADAIADLGGTFQDLSLSDVVKIDSTFHFYGYASHSSTYKIVHATGTTWNDPTGLEIVQATYGGHSVIQCPSVFRVGSTYGMWYSIGGAQPGARWTRIATSTDLATWDFSDTTDILSPQGSGWEEDETYCVGLLKRGTGPAPYTDVSGR